MSKFASDGPFGRYDRCLCRVSRQDKIQSKQDNNRKILRVKLAQQTFKTDVKRKTLNPIFNSAWFCFEIDDLEIQEEPLSIRVMDYDVYSANDAIGEVSLSLGPLLLQKGISQNSLLKSVNWSKNFVIPDISRGMSGWVPIYDTIQGIRGEINFIVKVELFSDSNKFRQSSCGVQFFHSTSIPHGFHAIIRGLTLRVSRGTPAINYLLNQFQALSRRLF